MTKSDAGAEANNTVRVAQPSKPSDAQPGHFDQVSRIDTSNSIPLHHLTPTRLTPDAAIVPAKKSKTKPATSDDKLGHRSRLLDRFRDGGSDAILDYEMLEMILFRAFPRGDTKPLAKALMAKFKTFSEVVNAPDDQLMEVAGIGQRAVDEIKLVRAAALRMMKN